MCSCKKAATGRQRSRRCGTFWNWPPTMPRPSATWPFCSSNRGVPRRSPFSSSGPNSWGRHSCLPSLEGRQECLPHEGRQECLPHVGPLTCCPGFRPFRCTDPHAVPNESSRHRRFLARLGRKPKKEASARQESQEKLVGTQVLWQQASAFPDFLA